MKSDPSIPKERKRRACLASLARTRRSDPSGAVFDLYLWREPPQNEGRKRGSLAVVRRAGELSLAGKKRAVEKGDMILLPPGDGRRAEPVLNPWTFLAALVILLTLLRLVPLLS